LSAKSKAKILVIRGGAIGDFILTLPVFAALRQQFPESSLEVLGYPQIAQLAVAGGLADSVRAIESRPMAGFFARGMDLDFDLSVYFSRFIITISYLYDPDEILKENIERCSHTQFIIGPHRPDEGGRAHATEAFLKPLEKLTIFGAETAPRLNIPLAPDNALPPGKWLAVHPGSGSEGKNWPERKWAELLPMVVANTDLNILLIGGEAEGERLGMLSATLPAARMKLARNLPLPALAQQMKQCTAFIGHDSGISHLAAALDLPGLILWGYSAQHIWRPKSDKLIIVREPKGLFILPVQQVMVQLTSLLNTSVKNG
jgi:heptosyltransferase-2